MMKWSLLLCVAYSYGQIDSILEKNDPKNLNMKMHQLYIDTTQRSDFYELIEKKSVSEGSSLFASVGSKKVEGNKVKLAGFSRYWVAVGKYKGLYYLYDRCDGMDGLFAVGDSMVRIYGPLEGVSWEIAKVKKNTAKEMELELRLGNYGHSTLSIGATQEKDIYEMKLGEGAVKVTPLDRIRNFDVIVNHCPTGKVSEYLRYLE